MLIPFVTEAAALTVPVRATLTETVDAGERPAAGAAATAEVRASNPTTGEGFVVEDGELTASKREAAGKGSLVFDAPPAASVRTWAVYFLDEDGEEVGDPEVVDVVFDERGNGSVAAREGTTKLAYLTTDNETRLTTVTVDFGDRVGYSGGVGVGVQDAGVDAAYIGIVELVDDDEEGAMLTAPDLEVMDADVYAAFQELGLDAIVPLTRFKVQLSGDLDVSGVAVAADGSVEGGVDLQWDLDFYSGDVACNLRGACTPVASSSQSYLVPIAPVRKRSGVAQRVTLAESDATYDSWDASMRLDFAGDLRGLSLAAAFDVTDGDRLVEGSDVVSLDASSLGVRAEATVSGALLPADTVEAWVTLAVEDSARAVVAEHLCRLGPTAATIAGRSGRQVYVGDCLLGDGTTDVRRVRVAVGEADTRVSMEMTGSLFAESARSDGTCMSRVCPDSSVTVLGGNLVLQDESRGWSVRAPMVVNETSFVLGFAFGSDITGYEGRVYTELDRADHPLGAWRVDGDALVFAERDTEIHRIEDLEVETLGRCDVGGGDVELVGGSASVIYTGPGKHKCLCKKGYR